ncbi:hypothetical protein RFI_27823 [Reticulomyxa filosa]|uniref:Uncharacterized protein n=1 Tax=Reticulomyxa filosa TaxID=46433 RepID=X6M7X0_RETFI|nr:hypothetical protein RFI_27823 [Reticulomyxa filosa]|eukprot:ETO09552.1 hypothetical protein RFI_27823 [Reticulomyxa filosa]
MIDYYELDGQSDYLNITFNILAKWHFNILTDKKIVTWNLSSNNCKLFRQYLIKNLEICTNTLMNTLQNSTSALDQAVESWNHFIVNTVKSTIEQKISCKENKPWWKNYERYKEASRLFKRIFRFEKQIYVTKTSLFANWFVQPQPPKPSNEDNEQYGYVEDEIWSLLVLLFGWSYNIGISKVVKNSKYCGYKPDRDITIYKNCSPISLLSWGKLMERIVTITLMKYLNENQMLHQSQTGFQY